jgi:hypothetical protein
VTNVSQAQFWLVMLARIYELNIEGALLDCRLGRFRLEMAADIWI